MSSFVASLRVTGRNIWAMALRNMQTQFSTQAAGYLWALLEPLGMIAILSLFFQLIGRTAPLGESYVLFFAAGVIPFRAYSNTQMQTNRAIKTSKNLLFFPVIQPLDIYIAPALLQLATMMMALLLFFGFFHLFFGEGLPHDWFNTFLPMVFMALYGLTIGIIFASISSVFNSWERLSTIITRPLFLLSGIFFLADSLPVEAKKYFYYNPLLHCTEWIRSGYYAGFESKFCDPNVIYASLGILIFFALLLERLLRHRLVDH
ncbi:MAG: hypothetical protein C0606_14365 [Hyphomicrobiales bacterium]|nr:MAG: hypothetical protein C0606_14365 [Hyphomicrobiales bacterium]